jgi:hypothetical protein
MTHTLSEQVTRLIASLDHRIELQERRYKRLMKTHSDQTSSAAQQKHSELMVEADALSRAYRNAQSLILEHIRMSEWSKDELRK